MEKKIHSNKKKESKTKSNFYKPSKEYSCYGQEYLSYIKTISYLFNDYYNKMKNLIIDLRNNTIEINKFIITIKCIINEMNNKINIQEKMKLFYKKIEDIITENKIMNNNIYLFEFNLNKYFDNVKLNIKNLREFHTKVRENLSTTNNNHIILQQKNINQYNNKINCLKLSLGENKINCLSQISNTSQNIEILKNNIRKIHKNISQKKLKRKNFNIKIDEIDLFQHKIKNRNPKNKKAKSYSFTKRNLSFNNMKTYDERQKKKCNKSVHHFRSTRYIGNNFLTSDKNNLLFTNYTNNKFFNSFNINTSKINENINLSCSSNDNKFQFYYSFSDNNTIFELLYNFVDYVYISIQFQNIFFFNQKNNKTIIYNKIKNYLGKLYKSIYKNKDILNKKNLLRKKISSTIRQSEDINNKLKILLSKDSNQINQQFNFLQNYEYNKILENLSNEKKNLLVLNNKIMAQNKILIKKLNQIQNEEQYNGKRHNLNQNINLAINKLLREKQVFLFQIENLKKDNGELLKIINNDEFNNNPYIAFDENKTKLRIKELNEEISLLRTKINTNNFVVKEKNSIINKLNIELNKIKNQLNTNKDIFTNEINELKNQIELKNQKIKENTQPQNINDTKNDNTLQQNIILEYEKKIKTIELEKEGLIIELEKCKIKIEELESSLKLLKEQKKNFDEKEDDKIKVKDIQEQVINFENNKKNISEENNQYSIEMMDSNNNDNQSRRMSTPSFKVMEGEELDYINLDKNEIIVELKKLNEILLKKVIEYESILKINDNEEEGKEEIKVDNNKIKEDSELIYFKNKYLQYYKLYYNYKKKCEVLESLNEELKFDFQKAKNEIKNLSTNLNLNKTNSDYSPENYIILNEFIYQSFKWLLMKRKSEQYQNNSYENLVIVEMPKVINLDEFNKYTSSNSNVNNQEIENLFKKLEEKENIISSLSYKIEKLEKELQNNIINDTNEKNTIPIEKFNFILDKLNQTEAKLAKLQKGNLEFRKSLIDSNNQLNKDKTMSSSVDKNKFNKNEINIFKSIKDSNNSFNEEENNYYKNQYNELKIKSNILKDGCKNILSKVNIPKKDKEEVKQILKLFEFKEEEILGIIGDKKIK